MTTRRFALILGVVFLIVGILGFVPGINSMHGADNHGGTLTVTGPGHGNLLGLFHVNLLHNLVHVLFGVYGIVASRTFGAARGYARFVAVAYGLLAILGLIPTANVWNTFGLIPIHGNDVWLHALIAAAAAFVGFGGIRETAPGGAPYTTTDTGPRV
jgi:hypothetical protein